LPSSYIATGFSQCFKQRLGISHLLHHWSEHMGAQWLGLSLDDLRKGMTARRYPKRITFWSAICTPRKRRFCDASSQTFTVQRVGIEGFLAGIVEHACWVDVRRSVPSRLV
jgi:hypothetical protein